LFRQPGWKITETKVIPDNGAYVSAAFDNIPECVPVFPLPEVVLFPREVLPLHIFEPRYLTMTADALAGEPYIAVGLLRPGYEQDYFTHQAPIHPIVGIGRIVASEQVADGKYNILLRGLARARIVEEYPDRAYRVAKIEILHPYCRTPLDERKELRRRLFDAIKRHLMSDSECCRHFAQLFEAPLALGELVDLVAAGLPVIGELRQCLLAELEDGARTAALLEHLSTLTSVTRQARNVDEHVGWKLN
jgi:uncharacterized protein